MTDTRTTVLKVATKLFSKKGYDGVSMRNIANEVKISAPALYNHFSDKQSLYLTAIAETFENKSSQILQIVKGSGKPIKRLENMIHLHCTLMHDDPDFRRLMQRELVDGDEKRLAYMAQEVFAPAITGIKELLKELKPDCDANSLIVTIIGMMHKHFELEPLMRFFEDAESDQADSFQNKSSQINPDYITNQVMDVLLPFLGEKK